MPFKIIRNDITKVSADAIVNTANPMPIIGRGTDSNIYAAAGREKLLAARKQIGVIECGKSAWTDSFDLKKNGINYIIHTVGVSYCDGKNGETDILRSCYSTSLNMAKNLGCKSIAIPLLATGFYSFPKEIGLQIAIDEISRFLIENEIDVTLVVYDRESYLISEKIFNDIQSFIDENLLYSEDYDIDECMVPCIREANSCKSRITGKPLNSRVKRSHEIKSKLLEDSTERKKYNASIDVDTFITQSNENLNFQNILQQFIAKRNVENAEIYRKALIDRKFFSKIISKKNYIPKKITVMALGLALELSLDEYETFLASAGYAFMPSSKFDLIIKYCVINKIYNLIEVDMILDSHGECCFASE